MEEQVGQHSTVFHLFRHLPCVCYQRHCDALGLSLVLGSVKSPQQKHQSFSSKPVFHSLMRMEDVNQVRLLEMLLASWKSWCLHFFLPTLILTMSVCQVHVQLVYSGQEKAWSLLLWVGSTFRKCKAKDSMVSWMLIPPSDVSYRWGWGQRWMRAIGDNQVTWFFRNLRQSFESLEIILFSTFSMEKPVQLIWKPTL